MRWSARARGKGITLKTVGGCEIRCTILFLDLCLKFVELIRHQKMREPSEKNVKPIETMTISHTGTTYHGASDGRREAGFVH